MKDRGIDALVNDSLVGTGQSSFIPPHSYPTRSRVFTGSEILVVQRWNEANKQSLCGEVSLNSLLFRCFSASSHSIHIFTCLHLDIPLLCTVLTLRCSRGAGEWCTESKVANF
jgi:hypothetical protein